MVAGRRQSAHRWIIHDGADLDAAAALILFMMGSFFAPLGEK
jgi:hypothetical protein